MLVWLVIAAVLGFGYLGLKNGLYIMFTILFNLLFAVFISILSTRTLLSYSPQYEHNGYYASFGLFLLFCVVFGLLQVFAWFYFLRYRDEFFHPMIDHVGGFLVGSICGYIVMAFLILVLCIMPCSVKGKLDWLCARDKMQGLCAPGMIKSCDFLAWYSLECFDGESKKAINELLELTKPKQEEKILYYAPEETGESTLPAPTDQSDQ